MVVNRKVLYRLYPTPKQEFELFRFFEIHRRFYNDARFRRMEAYKTEQRSISYYDQARETTQLRKAQPELAECNAQSLQVTLKRLDLAFKAFFAVVKQVKKLVSQDIKQQTFLKDGDMPLMVMVGNSLLLASAKLRCNYLELAP